MFSSYCIAVFVFIVSQAKKFLDLFLLLSSPEGTERNESPLVICLLGEVVQVLSPARRQKFQEHLLKKCKDHLHSPSNAITLGLLQLLVFKMPTECKGRVDILRRLCSVVTECCTNEQQLDEDEDEGDQHDFDKSDRDATTYTLVSRSTAATAITALVGMLEKLCGEMDILLKLSIKTSKVGKTSGAPSLIGSGDSTISDLWGEDVMDTCTANDMCAKEESEWRVNDHICRSLNNAMDIALSFLSFKSAGVVSHGILALFLKMVKLHVKITKLVSGSPAAERQQVTISQKYRSYRDLALNVATNVSQHLNRYITEVHNILDDPPGRQKKKGSASGGKAVHAKLSRLIPELIFQTEEIDLNVIKLMTGLKERDKVQTLISFYIQLQHVYSVVVFLCRVLFQNGCAKSPLEISASLRPPYHSTIREPSRAAKRGKATSPDMKTERKFMETVKKQRMKTETNQ